MGAIGGGGWAYGREVRERVRRAHRGDAEDAEFTLRRVFLSTVTFAPFRVGELAPHHPGGNASTLTPQLLHCRLSACRANLPSFRGWREYAYPSATSLQAFSLPGKSPFIPGVARVRLPPATPSQAFSLPDGFTRFEVLA